MFANVIQHNNSTDQINSQFANSFATNAHTNKIIMPCIGASHESKFRQIHLSCDKPKSQYLERLLITKDINNYRINPWNNQMQHQHHHIENIDKNNKININFFQTWIKSFDQE